jgi:hypothetical protein
MSIRRVLILVLVCAFAAPVGRGVAGPVPVAEIAKLNAAALAARPSQPAPILIAPGDDALAAQLSANIQTAVASTQTRLNLHTAPGQACDPNSQNAILRAISAPTPGVAPSVHLDAVTRASAALGQSGRQDPCTQAAFAQAIQLESKAIAPSGTVADLVVAVPHYHHAAGGGPLPPQPPGPGRSPASVPAESAAPAAASSAAGPAIASSAAAPAVQPGTVVPPTAPAVSASGVCKAGDGLPGLPACYNAPSTIPLYAETKFTLIIASNHPPTDADFQGSPGPVDERNVPLAVGSIVKAELTGPADQVAIDSSRTYICQTVTAGDNSRWDWYVSPKTRAPIQLQVTLWEVKSCDSDEYTSHYVDSFTIPVTASFTALVKYYAPPLNTVLLAIFGLIAAAGAAFGAWRLGGGKGGKGG